MESFLPVLVYGPVKFLQSAFTRGCSEFLRDPWTFGELFIRTERILKFSGVEPIAGSLRFREHSLFINSTRIPLTAREMTFLRLLIKMRGCPVPKTTLASILQTKSDKDSRAVDMVVSK